MMSQQDGDPPKRGLPAVQHSRFRRSQFLSISPRFVLWAGVVLAVWAIVYWKINQSELESWRNRLLANQRGVTKRLGPRLVPLRDKMEKWTVQSSGRFGGNRKLEGVDLGAFRSAPGVYLRLFIDDAKSPKRIRRAAVNSLRDGFTACLMRQDNPNPFAGAACKFTHDCKKGAFCNEDRHCTRPAQPYNLRVAYRAMRVLEDGWTEKVRAADSDMRLRLLERMFDSAVKDDIPLAVDLMARGRYFLLVLDEPADPATEVPDAGGPSDSLQLVHHPVRVMLWDMRANRLVFRYRADEGGGRSQLVGVTDKKSKFGPNVIPIRDNKSYLGERAQMAMQRQVNNCSFAGQVSKWLGLTDEVEGGVVKPIDGKRNAGDGGSGGRD